MRKVILLSVVLCSIVPFGYKEVRHQKMVRHTWYGMTYKEDVAAVQEAFAELLKEGKYREDLFSDL